MKKDIQLVRFGEKVRLHRNALNQSQETLAELTGLDRTYISGIERGVRNPGIKNVIALAKALRVKVGDFF